MAPILELSHLTNPIANSSQLETYASQLSGAPRSLEDAVRYETSRLIQAAGILLRLPQELIAQSIILLQRFWIGQDGESILNNNAQDVAAAALYLAAKPSSQPATPRQILIIFDYLASLQGDYSRARTGERAVSDEWGLSEGEYEVRRNQLYKIESRILRVLGFQTHVALPYSVCINYLQALEVFQSEHGTRVAKRAFEHLNGALLSPQLLYITHQPSAVAVASIYLAAREVDVKLPEVEWWEVFDVDREELGFLVVALRSLEGFAAEIRQLWSGRKVPVTAQDLRAEAERMRLLEVE